MTDLFNRAAFELALIAEIATVLTTRQRGHHRRCFRPIRRRMEYVLTSRGYTIEQIIAIWNACEAVARRESEAAE